MSQLSDQTARTDLLNRLKRAEGQLRGIQRMIEAGDPCLDIAGQMAAVRKALDSAYVRMTVCFMEQELQARFAPDAQHASALNRGARGRAVAAGQGPLKAARGPLAPRRSHE